MKLGWTGGQYSLVRLFLGMSLLGHFLVLGNDPLSQPMPIAAELLRLGPAQTVYLWAFGSVLSIFFALGKADKFLAWLLFFLLPLHAQTGILSPLVHPFSFVLIIHFLIPSKPYGSMAAAGRPDPAGDWHFPVLIHNYVWLFVAAMLASTALRLFFVHQRSFGYILPLLVLLLAGMGLYPKTRPIAWFVCAIGLGLLALQGALPQVAPFLILQVLAFQPAWLSAHTQEKDHLFFDGECGLCHRAVRFVLAEDRDGQLFTLSPLQGETFETLIDPATRATLPDSLIIRTSQGEVLFEARAVLRIGQRLGGLWRPLTTMAQIVPIGLLNRAYRLVARFRKRFFNKPKDLCPVMPIHLRNRFAG